MFRCPFHREFCLQFCTGGENRKPVFKIGEDVSLSEEEEMNGSRCEEEEQRLNVCDSTAACLSSCSTSGSKEMASFPIRSIDSNFVTGDAIIHFGTWGHLWDVQFAFKFFVCSERKSNL